MESFLTSYTASNATNETSLQKIIVYINPFTDLHMTLHTGNVYWNVWNGFRVFALRDIT